MTNGSDDAITLGGWADGDFQVTLSENDGIGADADLPDEHRFVAGVVRLLRRRTSEVEAQGEFDLSDIAIFVLQSSPPASAQNARRVPSVNNGLTMVVGRLWFTAPPVVSGHYIELPQDADDDARFSYVTDNLALGSLPTLIFDPRSVNPELRWYPKGLADTNCVEVKPLQGDVTPDMIFEAIEDLYRQCLVTPTSMPQGGNLWQNTQKYWVRKDAEARVQALLKAGLAMKFPFCTIRHEQTQNTGRTDLEISQINLLNSGMTTHHAILELKVLRSFGSTGISMSDSQTKEWILDGVKQAASYRMERGAQWSALCCFDMRKEDFGDNLYFADVQNLAGQLEVMLNRWFLHANARSYRNRMIQNRLRRVADDQ